MPKSMMWTEWLFSKLPFYDRGIKYQIVMRFLLVIAIWLIGLAIAAIDGVLGFYLTWVQIYPTLFGSMMIVLAGAYGVPIALNKTINSFEPLFEMDKKAFEGFKSRTTHYCSSTIPILVITLIQFLLLPSGLNFMAFPTTLWGAWAYILIFIMDFIMATGIWMGASLWITVFLISRQQFKTDISSNTVEKFRGLTTLSLFFSLFYFIAISIALIMPILTHPTTDLLNVLVWPIVFFTAGAAGTLLPFYNIHNTLLSIKKKLLENIDEEFERWQQELEMALAIKGGLSIEQTMLIMSNLFRLEMRERRTILAPEWPFDINFASKLLAVILIPAIVRIVVDVYSRTYLLPP